MLSHTLRYAIIRYAILRYATYSITYATMTIVVSQIERVNEPFDYIDHTLTRGGIAAKCHSIVGRKLIAAVLDEWGSKSNINMPG